VTDALDLPVHLTPLTDAHTALGARLIEFSGWLMPVQYGSIIDEHRTVRERVGLFDLSHMGELYVEGPDAGTALASALVSDPASLAIGRAHYSMICTPTGGIIDDLIVYREMRTRFLAVVNASNTETDFRWLKEREIRGSEVTDVSSMYALLAVQGPRTFERLELGAAPSFSWSMGELDGIEVMINRTGYTGEDGVELGCMAEDGPALWDAILARGATPCGLGARDTLRLEACFPLHGNDITPETDPISAGLGWACALGKEFTGVEAIRRVKAERPERRLVPFVMEERGIPRPGMAIAGGGTVTSGSHSPMLDKGIGLGYMPAERAKAGTELAIDIRGNERRATIVKKPIYQGEG
jgi:aminomethyltransferase